MKNEISWKMGILRKRERYVEADPLQGWHIEGDFYSFNSELIREKINEIEVISKVRQNLAEKRLLMSWKW